MAGLPRDGLTVACVLRSGGFYDPSWVAKLRAGVARHLKARHEFVVLTDDTDGCQSVADRTIRLAHNWPGWWSKIELFKPGNFNDWTLYIDLDCVIVGSLSSIWRRATKPFNALQDFIGYTPMNSSVMLFDGYVSSSIYRSFVRVGPTYAMQQNQRGDQEFIGALRPEFQSIQDYVPGLIHSLRLTEAIETRPDLASIIVCHGRPKPCDLPADHWLRREWENPSHEPEGC